MKIEILGMGCPKCKKTLENVQSTVKNIGIEADICEVKDAKKIVDYGVMMTPAVVVDGKVKCSGKVPKDDEIKGWIEEKL